MRKNKLEVPEVAVSDWIEFQKDRWIRVLKVFELGRIECVIASNSKAYKREFGFKNGRWHFLNPDPDGVYLPIGEARKTAEMLKKGPSADVLKVTLGAVLARPVIVAWRQE